MGLIARVVALPGLVRGLSRSNLDPDPVKQFDRWYQVARKTHIYWPNSVALATATSDGRPSVRMVLLKQYDQAGFVFYTNYSSRKGRELEANPQAEMVIYWNDLMRQVRIRGTVQKTSREESLAYFHSRPRGSQVGAWASNQDSIVEDRDALMARYAEYEARFKGSEIPLPDDWGGYRLVPDAIEFWQGRMYRLHDRFLYTRADHGWRIDQLSP